MIKPVKLLYLIQFHKCRKLRSTSHTFQKLRTGWTHNYDITIIPALQHTFAQVWRCAPVSKQLVSEAHGPSADIAFQVGLKKNCWFLRSICPKTEHLLRTPFISQQQIQFPTTFDVYTGATEVAERFDAHCCVAWRWKIGLQDNPQSLVRVHPLYRPFRAAQPHLLHRPRVSFTRQTTGYRAHVRWDTCYVWDNYNSLKLRLLHLA